ncbi:MAG TPA: hypothetical protein P5121_39220, partial [Caldilineaceae bacterium]|nr:hypothetical protein [Caldilineaceae bacterium]
GAIVPYISHWYTNQLTRGAASFAGGHGGPSWPDGEVTNSAPGRYVLRSKVIQVGTNQMIFPKPKRIVRE